MKFKTLLKTIAAVVVLGSLTFACMLAWHVAIEPLGGPFERLIPESAGLGAIEEKPGLASVEEEEEIPMIDPGESIYRSARQALALGQIKEAREKLSSVAKRFPHSASAARSRQVLSEMNLDEMLSLQSMEGKIRYKVVPGDSYLGIAARQKTTLENILHLNGMTRMSGLRPGDEMVLMALDGRLVIDCGRKTLSIYNGEDFLCEFPIRSMPSGISPNIVETVIDSKAAYVDGKRVLPDSNEYSGSRKTIQLRKPPVRIQGGDPDPEDAGGALILDGSDIEELNLLVRPGNVVEFR